MGHRFGRIAGWQSYSNFCCCCCCCCGGGGGGGGGFVYFMIYLFFSVYVLELQSAHEFCWGPDL